MLYPWWGGPARSPSDPAAGCFDRYIELGPSFFDFTSLPSCDLVVFPVDWSAIVKEPALGNLANQFVERARRHNKPVVILYWNDDSASLPFDHAIVLRTSIESARHRRENEYCMPSWYEDPVEEYFGGRLVLRPKQHRASIGFCGLAHPVTVSVRSKVKATVRKLLRNNPPPIHGHQLRWRIIKRLQETPGLDTSFKLRDGFYAGAADSNGQWDLQLKGQVRKEYVENMIGTDYNLCARGNGNYSHRFYETFCCGRIPLYVYTDNVLPLDFVVRWQDYCVWVDVRDIENIGTRLLQFHNAISEGDFKTLQRDCRAQWVRWLSPEGFFREFYRIFDSAS